MLFMNHQSPLEAPSMVACFHHKIPTGLYFVQDAARLQAKRLAGKNVSEINYSVSSGT